MTTSPGDPSIVDVAAGRPSTSESRRRMFRRRRVTVAVAVLAVIGLIAAVPTWQFFERRGALDAFASAIADEELARDEVITALDERDATIAMLDAALATVDPLVAIGGNRAVSAADVAALHAGRDAATAARPAELAAVSEPTSPNAPTGEALDKLTTDVVRELTETSIARAEAHRAAAESIVADTGQLLAAYSAIDSASSAFVARIGTWGSQRLVDRADAEAALITTADAALTDLAAARAGDRADAAAAVLAAINAVVASSDAARQVPTEVTDAATVTTVVNRLRSLPPSYLPTDLVLAEGVENPTGALLRREAAAALASMVAEMSAGGLPVMVTSGFRSYEDQASLYDGRVAAAGAEQADAYAARPGHSEHQTGLAVDFDDLTGCGGSDCFGTTPTGAWLAENSWRYGFILRYPQGVQDRVGFSYEPWHFRYVGVETATAMHEGGWATLEEFFDLPPAPNYG